MPKEPRKQYGETPIPKTTVETPSPKKMVEQTPSPSAPLTRGKTPIPNVAPPESQKRG